MTNNTTIDTLRRAREMKVSTMKNVSILQPAPSSSAGDPAAASFEDTLITALRSEGSTWGDITAQLNEGRIANEDAPKWTEAGVYSRFVLIDSAVATPAREVGFEPRDYAHLRNAGSGHEGSSKAGKKRVKDFHNATELSANIRKPAIVTDAHGESAIEKTSAQGNAKGKGKATPKAKGKGKDEERRKGESEEEYVKMDAVMVELLMRAVAKVERNFWIFVADEVEREAGKYVEPKELEKVFHNI